MTTKVRGMNSLQFLCFRVVAYCTLSLWGFTVAGADTTISLRPVTDTSLLSAFPDNNFGGGTTLTAGGRPKGGMSRALMLFDIAGSLPPGAVIDSASLRITVVLTPGSSVNSVFDLNRLSASWGPGTGSDRTGSPAGPNEASWNNRFGSTGSPWATSGGDFSPVVSASTGVGGNGLYTFNSTASLIADVQGWLNNPSLNFGWLLRSESELTPGTIRRFGSHNDSFNSPLLTIQYSVPEPGACALLAVGVAVWEWRRRRTHSRAR